MRVAGCAADRGSLPHSHQVGYVRSCQNVLFVLREGRKQGQFIGMEARKECKRREEMEKGPQIDDCFDPRP